MKPDDVYYFKLTCGVNVETSWQGFPGGCLYTLVIWETEVARTCRASEPPLYDDGKVFKVFRGLIAGVYLTYAVILCSV